MTKEYTWLPIEDSDAEPSKKKSSTPAVPTPAPAAPAPAATDSLATMMMAMAGGGGGGKTRCYIHFLLQYIQFFLSLVDHTQSSIHSLSVFFQTTLKKVFAHEQIIPCERAWKTKQEKGFFSSVPFCLRSHWHLQSYAVNK